MKALYGIVFALAVLGILFVDAITDFFEVNFWEGLLFFVALGMLAASMCYKLGWI